jgi:hypothetical protein
MAGIAALRLGCANGLWSHPQTAQFHVVALAEKGGIHKPFVDAAKTWLGQEAVRDHFTIDYISDTRSINDAFLSRYQLFIQLNYPPYDWTPAAVAAFERYIDEGRGGWIGFHHATLLGHFDGFGLWPWFSEFMGGIQFKSYIATFVSGDEGSWQFIPDRQRRVVHLGQRPTTECARAGDRGRGQLHADHQHQNGRRPSGSVDQRARQSAKYLYIHGPSSRIISEQIIHDALS